MVLKQSMDIKIRRPGPIASHHAGMYCLASLSILPQLTSPIGRPICRKESEDSIKMAVPILRAVKTMIGLYTLGKTC